MPVFEIPAGKLKVGAPRALVTFLHFGADFGVVKNRDGFGSHADGHVTGSVAPERTVDRND